METIDGSSFHINLAKYFAEKPLYLDEPTQKKPNKRKLVEQPWQQTKGEMWDEVTETLCSLDFIQAKAAAKITYELVNDFNEVLEVIPDNAETFREEKENQSRMDRYIKNLITSAKGEITIDELEIPESITPWTEQHIDAEIIRIKNNPTKADRLKEFYNFLGQKAGLLTGSAEKYSHFSTQLAWNYASDGAVGQAAEKGYPDNHKTLLCYIQSTRPQWNPLPLALQTLLGHTSDVHAVSITPDAKWAISGSVDNTCIFWNLQNVAALKILRGHTDTVRAVSITPDGKRAISGSNDKTCIIWNLQSGTIIKVLKMHSASVTTVTITPDGKYALTGSEDNTCILWNLLEAVAMKTLVGHNSSIRAVSITSDGKRAISCSRNKFLDVEIIGLEELKAELSAKTCILWDLQTGVEIKTLKSRHNVDNSSITPDGKWAIAILKSSFILWNLITGVENTILLKDSLTLTAVSITSDGKMAFAGTFEGICILLDIHSGAEFKRFKSHISSVNAVSITPDGRRAISCSNDKACIVWDIQRGTLVKSFLRNSDPVTAISIFPDGEKVLSISPFSHSAKQVFDDNNCILWNLKTGEKLKSFTTGNTGYITAVSISPDGKQAITASKWHCIVWDLQSGIAIKSLDGHSKRVDVVSISIEGKRAISASADKTCIVWDLQSGDVIRTLPRHTKTVNAVSITPDGKLAISASSDGTCIIWDIQTGAVIKFLRGHSSIVTAVSISPNGKMVISGSFDNTCILWDLQNGTVLKTLCGHTSWVNAVSFTPDGKRAISGSRDKSCVVWDLQSEEKLAQIDTEYDVNSIVLFPKGFILGCNSTEEIVLYGDKYLLSPGIAITTVRQIWDSKLKRYQKLSADCPLCGNRIAPPALVLATIEKITKKSGLKPDQSPCLELSGDAWEDPNLLSICPKCEEKLKFNPFIAGEYNPIPTWKFWKR